MFNIFGLSVWLSLGILPVLILIAIIRNYQLSKDHKSLVTYYSRYISTRQATNDLLEVIIFNLVNARNLIVQARDVIRSQQTSNNEQQHNFDLVTNDFDNITTHLPNDNELSVNRSYTTEIFHKTAFTSPIKSFWFIIPALVSYSLLLYSNYSSDQGLLSSLLQFMIISLQIFFYYQLIKRINLSKSLKLNTQKKLITTLNLFDIRRIFIGDILDKLNQSAKALDEYQDYCKNFPQARGFHKGLEILKLNSEWLKDIYDITNLNVDTPLMSVNPILTRAAENQYGPAAERRNVKFINDLKPGISFHMSQVNISRLIDNLVLNAISNSTPGQTVTIKGGPRSGKVEIEVIEQTGRIAESELADIFRFDPKKIKLPQAGYIDLTLRMSRLIISTEGGEIKISVNKDKVTNIKLVIPKNRRHSALKVSPTIGKSSSPIN